MDDLKELPKVRDTNENYYRWGGTAGWVSLAYLAATTDAELTIIHSEEVDSLGVGESTTPTIKHVAETCGIDEVQWMKDAKASFKYGIEFLDF